MSATPPEARSEYSRGLWQSRRAATRDAGARSRDSRGGEAPAQDVGRGAAAAIVAGSLLGALLLIVAEFTTLFDVRTAATAAPIKAVSTGSHHAYALIPIALLVVALAWAVWAVGSRPALLAIGILGVLALLIALLGDLPDAHASGLIGSSASHFTTASSRPRAGLYIETLGAVVLLITSVCGFLLLGPPPARSRTALTAECLDSDRGS